MAKEIILAHIYKVTLIVTFRGENANRSLTYAKKEYVDESDMRKEVLLGWVKDSKTILEESQYYKKLNAKLTDFKFKGIKVEYKGTDRWWLKWFSHQTFSKFATEREMFDDFINYSTTWQIFFNSYRSHIHRQ